MVLQLEDVGGRNMYIEHDKPFDIPTCTFHFFKIQDKLMYTDLYTFGSWNNIIVLRISTKISALLVSRRKNSTLLCRFIIYTITGNLRSKRLGNNSY